MHEFQGHELHDIDKKLIKGIYHRSMHVNSFLKAKLKADEVDSEHVALGSSYVASDDSLDFEKFK